VLVLYFFNRSWVGADKMMTVFVFSRPLDKGEELDPLVNASMKDIPDRTAGSKGCLRDCDSRSDCPSRSNHCDDD